MMAEKDEALNLFYLFEGEEIYLVQDEPQPFVLPIPALSEEKSLAEQPVETPVTDEAVLPEAPSPLEVTPKAESVIASAITALPDKIAEETAPESRAVIDEVITTFDEGINTIESVAVMPIVSRDSAPVSDSTQHSSTEAYAADTEEKPVLQEGPLLQNPVVIVINEHRSTALNVYDAAFLEKVLQAVGLSLDKVDIMNVSGVPNPDYSFLLKQKTVRHFMSFGVPMESLHLYELLPYEVTFFGGIRFLYADTLEGVRTDVERKKWLWNALRKMFGK